MSAAKLINEHNYCLSPDNIWLKIVTINVGGLKSKVKYPEFQEFVSDYDIIWVTGTHLDMFDVIDLANYFIHNKICKYCKRGISIIYKKNTRKIY